MLKNISLFFSSKLNVLMVFVGVFFTIASIALYIITGSTATTSLKKKILFRKQIVVRSGASSIENFLKMASGSVVLLAKQFESIPTADMEATLDTFVSSWESTPVKGAVVIDKDGYVLFFPDKNAEVCKGSALVSNRDYFLWAMEAKQGDIFIGKPLLPREETMKAEYLLPLATPIYKNDQLIGVLIAVISLSELTENYLDSLKIIESSELYLLSSDGVLLYTPENDLIGFNFYDFMQEKPFFGSDYIADLVKKKIVEKKEGTIDLAFPSAHTKVLTPMLTAYAPVNYNGHYWILAMATPAADALAFLAPFYISQLGMLIVGCLVLILFTIVIIRHYAYYEGFADGKGILKRGEE